MNVLREIVITTRPKQYVKNLLVFLGILFSGKFKDHLYDKGFVVLFAFVSFLLISSAVYIFNDLRDRNNDKTHPKKKNRPIASGRLSVQLAFCCLLIFLGSGFLLGYMIGTLFMMCLVVYIAINFLYSLVLKNVVILDVFCVSSGYVIRTLAGVFAVEAVITIWLILCIGFASLFIVFAKRRGDISILGRDAAAFKPTLGSYSLQYLDVMIIASAVLALTTYILFVIFLVYKGQNQLLVLTIPFIVFTVFRYIHLVFTSPDADSPETLLCDKMLLVNNLIWLVLFVLTKFDYLTANWNLFEIYLK